MLPAGKYWIGDPCYMLDETRGYDWGKLLDQTRYFGLYPDVEEWYKKPYASDQGGEFVINGHKMYAHSTQYGDGGYYDQHGHDYGVDAGLLSIIPIELIGDLNEPDVARLGHIHDMPEPFTCHYDNGTIYFGHIVIPTGDEDDDEDSYWDEEE